MLNILTELNQGGSGRKKNGGEIKKDSINKEKKIANGGVCLLKQKQRRKEI